MNFFRTLTVKRHRPLPGMNAALRRGFNCCARNPHVMAIRTGQSVTIAGHLIELRQDERTKVAVVVVTALTDRQLTETERSAVAVAADLLHKRSQRMLGCEWSVVPWVTRRPVPGPSAGER